MEGEKRTRINPGKLLLSKWTAVTPQNREKHFIVTKVLEPELATAPIVEIELEAVHSKRVRTMRWKDLTDRSLWLPGWI
jgi:tryptophan-rich hypothetical protein